MLQSIGLFSEVLLILWSSPSLIPCCPSLTIIQVVHSWVPPKRSKTTPFSIVSAPFSIENGAETIENGAETKHLNSTRTARPPKGPGSSSRIQMLKSSRLRKPIKICQKITRIARNSTIFGPNKSSRRDLFLENFWKNETNEKFFRKKIQIFEKLFVRFVLSKLFPEIGGAQTIRLVQKSSNFELSSWFFGRLTTETKRNRLY